MKKIILFLFSVFMLSSMSTFGYTALICNGSGVARLVEFTYDNNGIPIITSSTDISMCDGVWFTFLNRVVPSGPEPCCELTIDNYNKLNSEDPYVPSEMSPSESADLATIIEEQSSTAAEAWVNPFKLSSQARTAIYGSQIFEMFYVHTAIRTSDGANMLKLYSDSAKTMTVTYKTLLGVTVDSESVSVSAGSNNIELTVPISLSNGTYNVIVTGSSTNANTTIVISH